MNFNELGGHDRGTRTCRYDSRDDGERRWKHHQIDDLSKVKRHGHTGKLFRDQPSISKNEDVENLRETVGGSCRISNVMIFENHL